MKKMRRKPISVRLPIGDSIAKNNMMDPIITELALDADQYPNAIDYVNLYLELLKVDRENFTNPEILASEYVAEFRIAELEKEIKNIPDKKLQKRLRTFFNLDNTGIRHYLKTVVEKDIAMVQMITDATDATRYLMTIRSAYNYNSTMKEVVDKIATKVYGDADNVTKALYAHVFYRYFKDGPFLAFFDDNIEDKRTTDVRETATLSPERIAVENQAISYQSIGMLTDEWKLYYSKTPDNNLIMDLVKEMLKDLYEEDINFIEKEAQLKKGAQSYKPTYKMIRERKANIFPKGEWLVSDFMRFDSMDKLYAKDIRELCKLYQEYTKTYEWKSDKTIQMEAIIPTIGRVMVEVPTFGAKKFFKDEFEMLAFTNLMTYLKKNQANFVYHKKALAKYDFFEIMGI